MLAAGITTVRDVGSYDDEAIVLREAIRLGLVDGPRILSCGRIISATGVSEIHLNASGSLDSRMQFRNERCFMGGANDAAILQLSDEEILAIVRRELREIVLLDAEPGANSCRGQLRWTHPMSAKPARCKCAASSSSGTRALRPDVEGIT